MSTCHRCARPRAGEDACRCESWEFEHTAASWPEPKPMHDLDELDDIALAMEVGR